MWCMKCNNHLSKCTCPDINERLEKLGQWQHLITEFCKNCGLHRDRCKCEYPNLQKTGLLKPTN